jgi:hypothetical protein
MTGAFPTFAEIPRCPAGSSRGEDEFLRLMLIPRDDDALRKLAVRYFHPLDRLENEVPQAEGEWPKGIRDVQLTLSSTPALTPGGIAWKLSAVQTVLELRLGKGDHDSGEWEWWHYLVKSAMTDAIELERARQAGAAGGAP